ncbi:MAG: DnaJ domain-containing protein [Acidobacteriota bacterium]
MATSDIRNSSPLLGLLRDAYLRRRSGRLRREGGRLEIYLREGELYFDRDADVVTSLGSEAIARAASLERPMADPAMAGTMKRVAEALLGSAQGEAQGAWTEELPAGLEWVGPLPTLGLLLAAVVHEADETQLIERLGGSSARLESRDETPATRQLPGLDPDMARVLVLLQQPASVDDVVRGGGGDRLATLRGLAKLWASGLVGPQGSDDAETESVVSPKILETFLARIAEALESRPVELEMSEHRSRLAELFGRLGELDHYQLLGLEVQSDESEIPGAYDLLGRQVHPSHAESLGWAGKEGTLRLLFERATEAYLVLSDPVRRSSYNTLMGLHNRVEIDDFKRDEEKRFLARQNYLQATTSLSEADYSTAVDLLKESVRIDPKVEYFALLGQAQAKNPNWRRHAVDTYRRAVEMKPEDSGLHLALAKVLEAEGQLGEAREHFAASADLMPGNVDAQEGLVRLGGGLKAASSGVGQSLRSVLSRRRR